MAKESGMGAAIIVDDSATSAQTISNDITNYTISTPRNVQDVTGVDKSAVETLQLLADAAVTLNGVFNDASNMSHAVLKTVPSSSVARTVSIAVSGQTLAMEMNINDYNMTRGQDGSLTWTAPCALQSGTAPTWS